MSAEFWAILGVGVAFGGLPWRMYASLNGRLDRIEGRLEHLDTRVDRMQEALAHVKECLSRIEGWIAGRFREESAAT